MMRSDEYKPKMKLPEHMAPEQVWENVEQQLKAQKESHLNLQTTIKQLPTYSSPDQVWGEINKQLIKKRKKIVYFPWYAIAGVAVIVLFSWLGWLMMNQDNNNIISYLEVPDPTYHSLINIETNIEEDQLSDLIMLTERAAEEDLIAAQSIKNEKHRSTNTLLYLPVKSINEMYVPAYRHILGKRSSPKVSANTKSPQVSKLRMSLAANVPVPDSQPPKRSFFARLFQPPYVNDPVVMDSLYINEPLLVARFNLSN